VVQRPARTETVEAPRGQGATTENIEPYLKEKQRSHRGRIGGRMPSGVAPRAAGPAAAPPRQRAKREKVRVGKATVNASDLKSLRYAWQQRELVLFLGAGVSLPYGLPAWRDLVLELLFEQSEQTQRLGRMWPHYRRAVASWIADYFDYDPLVLARVVEWYSDERRADPDTPPFLERLRQHLYAHLRPPAGRTLLASIADLVARTNTRSGVGTIVTFNFDDLLERELARRNVRFTTVAGGARNTRAGVRIVHAHGYLPQEGLLSRQNVVFTEPDYHRLTEAVFHWALSEIVERLRKNTVLFIGLSMSDPNLRRLLDASRNADIPSHYQLQRRHEIRAEDMPAVMADVERRARDQARLLGPGFDETKRPDQLEEAVGSALRQADTYDREVFESMGVKTIWVDSFDELPDIVGAIAKARRRR
jgi:hypothetical protein